MAGMRQAPQAVRRHLPTRLRLPNPARLSSDSVCRLDRLFRHPLLRQRSPCSRCIQALLSLGVRVRRSILRSERGWRARRDKETGCAQNCSLVLLNVDEHQNGRAERRCRQRKERSSSVHCRPRELVQIVQLFPVRHRFAGQHFPKFGNRRKSDPHRTNPAAPKARLLLEGYSGTGWTGLVKGGGDDARVAEAERSAEMERR